MKFDTQLEKSMLAGDLIITENHLQAEHLHTLFLQHCFASNIRLVEKPAICSIENWISYLCYKSMIKEPTAVKRLLNDIQSVHLLGKLMQPSLEGVSEKIQLAYQAWIVYQLLGDESSLPQYSHQWQHWAFKFNQQCVLNRWQDKYHYLATLIKENRLHSLYIPHTICLVGFDTTHFYYQAFFQNLIQKGHNLKSFLTASTIQSPVVAIQSYTTNIHAELYHIAHQVWQYWKEHPEDMIGCAIFNLKTRRDAALMTFHTVYHSLFNSGDEYPLIVPLETCKLTHYPIIQTVLDILSLKLPALELSSLTRLLRTGYIQNQNTEKTRRIQLDKALRTQRNLGIDFQTLIEQTNHYSCFELMSILQQWEKHYRRALHREQTYHAWADYFKLQFKTWGWSNLLDLSYEEKYCINLLYQQLDQLASLDLVHTPIGYQTALAIFIQLVESVECPFQIQSSKKGIYLIDLAAAVQFSWDKLWTIYSNTLYPLDDIAKNPFIPSALQSNYRNHNRYINLLKELIYVSSATTLSIAEEEYTEVKQMLSQWIAVQINVLEKEKPANPQLFIQMKNAIVWEYHKDHHGPPLNPKHTYQAAQLLKTQSLCPFRAFSDYRLGLKGNELTWPQQSFKCFNKSKLLYQLLQAIWIEIKTQAKLKSFSSEVLDQLINQMINNQIALLLQKQPWIWQPVFSQIEKERLLKILNKYLEIEKARPSFQVVNTQQTKIYCIGPLQLAFTIDRIDQLEDGTLLFICYKASTAALPHHKWIKDGTLAASLSLSALSGPDESTALTFLQFLPDDQIKFYGFSKKSINITGIHALPHPENTNNTSFENLLQAWHSQFEALAQQFYQGNARVNPKEGTKSCRNCQYNLLCRITENNIIENPG